MNFEGNAWGAVIAVIMLANAIITLWSGRKGRATAVDEGQKTRADVQEVHKVINSQLTEERRARTEQETKLVAATQKAAFLEGAATVTTKKE